MAKDRKKSVSQTAESARREFLEYLLAGVEKVTSPPIKLGEENLSTAFPVMINLIMDKVSSIPKKAEDIEALYSAETASNHVSAGKEASNLESAASALGTHTGKIPDARVTLASLIDQTDAEVKVGAGWTSRSKGHRLRMLGGCSAGLIRPLRLLTTRIEVYGKTVAIYEILGNKGHPFHELILSNLSDEAVAVLRKAGDAAYARLGGGTPMVVDHGLKTLLFPDGNGEYVAVTPLYSMPMAIELNARVSERRKDVGHIIRIENIHVGGTKPQNAGILLNDLAGRSPRISARPPVCEPASVAFLAERMRNGLYRVTGNSVPRDALMALRRLLADAVPSNINVKTGIENTIRWCVDSVLDDVDHVFRSDLPVDAGKASPPVYARLAGLAEGGVSLAEVYSVAEEVTSAIAGRFGRFMSTANEKYVVDDRLRSRIRDIARASVKEFI